MNEPHDNGRIDDAELTAPESLINALRDRKHTSGRIPTEIDQSILRQAHAHLAKTQRESSSTAPAEKKLVQFPGIWVRFAAAAAVVLLGVFLWMREPSLEHSVEIAVEQPTVVDAFLLARKVESGETVSIAFDVNNDGRVDEADAIVLAQRAVKLPEGGAL